MSRPTYEQVRTLFIYNPATGVVTYAVDAPPRGKSGEEAGSVNRVSGYKRLSVSGKVYNAHLLIWLWMTGNYPPQGQDVDHEDRNRLNNRWSNLRLASRSQNLMNQGKKSNNESGYKGVTSRGNSHIARFRFEGRVIRLGPFSSAREAAEAYDQEVVKYQGEFAKTNRALGLLKEDNDHD